MASITRPSDRSEIVLPFPNGATRLEVPVAQHFRATWLAGSLRALRERGYYDRYVELLPKEHHETILGAVAGTWLPAAECLVHYEACDKLGLSSPELVEIGREVTRQVHGSVLGFIVRLAKNAGVTPWTVLPKLGDLWDRIWIGGGVCVVKLGPKEARIEIGGWPCARTHYCRVAMRGIIASLVELFCTRAYANEIKAMCTPTTLGYRLSWV
jgi:hypothetical protein